MQNSGSKLVLFLLGGALLLGAGSWWYRYSAAHRASQFWGPEASRLIAEGQGFEVLTLQPGSGESLAVQVSESLEKPTNLDHARGQAHLRHALMTDFNYVWSTPLESSTIKWQWSLRFFEGDRQVLALLSSDLKAIGKIDASASQVDALSCEPVAESMTAYFEAVGLLAKPQTPASTSAE